MENLRALIFYGASNKQYTGDFRFIIAYFVYPQVPEGGVHFPRTRFSISSLIHEFDNQKKEE